MMEQGKKKWALISVYDKAGIVDFAKSLVNLGFNILSSGGTAKVLREAGIPVKDVAELVGGGAILGHRVVTLSREVHAGLLADVNNHEHIAEMERLGLPIINLVCCDFYPLSKAIADPEATIDSVIELTDIGGPCMVRSAAKGGRIVICRAEDREPVLMELKEGGVSPETIQRLRARAEFEVAIYVAQSAMFHGGKGFFATFGERVAEFKGENGPQSPAGLYTISGSDPLALDQFKVIEGASPSYNNWCDVDRLLQTMTHLASACSKLGDGVVDVAIGVKHGNSCGVGVRFPGMESDVIRMMVTGDTRAIFGGLVMTNIPITRGLAEIMVTAGMPEGKTQKFDGVIAPSFDDDAIEVFRRKGGKCRLIVNQALDWCRILDKWPRMRQVRGGFLLQPNYTYVPDFSDPRMLVSGEVHLHDQLNLAIGWGVGCTSNSNTITITKNGMLLGNGVGQQDRVGAAQLAIRRAIDAGHEDELNGACAYSDSFFPFPDAVDVLISSGIGAIFSTSGSVNDKDVLELCKSHGVNVYQQPDSVARGFFGH